MPTTIMYCGCRADALDDNGPYCSFHHFTADETQSVYIPAHRPVPKVVLEKRMAVCHHCNKEVPSKEVFATEYFSFEPNNGKDIYYCANWSKPRQFAALDDSDTA